MASPHVVKHHGVHAEFRLVYVQTHQDTSSRTELLLSASVTMPTLPVSFAHINITELHPTFGAEIHGVDFTHPVEEKVFQEILAALSKVDRLPVAVHQLH